jgi:uncharacterized membrane protein
MVHWLYSLAGIVVFVVAIRKLPKEAHADASEFKMRYCAVLFAGATVITLIRFF